MTSVSAPYAGPVQGPATIVFPYSNGLTTVYLDEVAKQFTDTTLKIEGAYTLHEAGKKTENITKIIESGRVAVLKVKDGALQGILIHPKLTLISDVTKFILFIKNNNGVKGAVLLSQMPVGRLNEEQYKKISAKLI